MRISTLFSKCTLLSILAFATHSLFAQDIHFSQYYSQPSLLNPSLVGNYDGSYRLSAIYRNQWTSALGMYGYQTFAADGDVSLLEGYLKDDKLCLGVGFFNDISGAAKLSDLTANLSLAYHKSFDKNGQHRLSAGLQAAYLQNSITDPIFGDQFTGYNSTPLNASREIVAHSISRFDFNAGIYWRSNFKDRVKFGIGFALYHITTPDMSFTKDTITKAYDANSVIPRKYVVDANVEVFLDVHKKWSLSPELLYLYQSPFTQILGGLSTTYYFSSGFRNNNSFSFGLRVRAGGNTPDAIIPMANVEFRNIRVGFSYDANISGLETSTNNRGAFELSLVYVGESIKSYKANKSLPSRRF
jgi:type IX secretion system PorP/SprF family membrane protein